MADLIAREAMKDLDRDVGPHSFPRRKSKVALESDGHFRFLKLGREYCAKLKELIVELDLESGYTTWLHDTGRVQNGHSHDNWYNRFTYLAWLDDPDAVGPSKPS